VLVDNARRTGRPERVRAEFSSVEVLALGENRYFAAA